MPVVYPDYWADISDISGAITLVLVWMSVILCLVRGAPVVIEFLRMPKEEG
jgi:hypothetical protein